MVSKLLKHPLLKSSLIYTLCDAVNKAVPFLVLPLLSYYLTPGDYGIVANFGVLTAIISIFVFIGVDSAIAVNFFRLSKEDLAKYIFNGILLIVLCGFISFSVALIWGNFIYSYLNIPMTYQLLAVIMALGSAITGINLSLWRLEEKPFNFSTFKIAQTVLEIGISLFLVVIYKLGWIGRINGILFANLSFGVLSLFFIYKRRYLKFNFSRKLIYEVLKFGVPLIPHSLSFWLRSGVDRIFITAFVGVSATGLYATGFQFGVMISFLTIAFNNAFVPYMYKLLSENDNSLYKKNINNLKKMILTGISLLIILCVIFTIVSDVILDSFFSADYQGASIFIRWAILAQTFQGMYLFFVNYIFYMKKTQYLALITFSCALLHVIMSYILVSKIGAIGAAYSTAFVSFVNFIIIAWYSNKIFPMNWFKIN